MKNKRTMSKISYLALLAGLLGYFFRNAFEGGGSRLPVIGLCILMTLLFLLAALSLEKETVYAEVFHGSKADLTVSVLGAFGFAIGGVLMMGISGLQAKLIGMLAIIAAACMVGAALNRHSQKQPQVFFYVLIDIFYIVKLILNFRGWMVDASIMDYCFLLFAMIGFMLATYQVSAFCFDKGNRRQLAFFSLCGVLFGTVSIAGSGTAEAAIYAGSVLWMLACAFHALTA